MRIIFMPCFHCEDPWCLRACPTGAMQQREKDGIVLVESSLCIGCESCIAACPWGVPQWDPATHKGVKCDYCKAALTHAPASGAGIDSAGSSTAAGM